MGEVATVNSVEHAIRLVELMAGSEHALGVSQGFALDADELIAGLTCVAVPVVSGGYVCGAISVAGPTARLGKPEALARILKAATKTLPASL